jgi:hypothetical protein
LAEWSKTELLKLHGIDPASLPKLPAALSAVGKSFKDT